MLAKYNCARLTWEKNLLALFTGKASNSEDGRGLCSQVSTSTCQYIGCRFN
jgi:hypothetical protein